MWSGKIIARIMEWFIWEWALGRYRSRWFIRECIITFYFAWVSTCGPDVNPLTQIGRRKWNSSNSRGSRRQRRKSNDSSLLSIRGSRRRNGRSQVALFRVGVGVVCVPMQCAHWRIRHPLRGVYCGRTWTSGQWSRRKSRRRTLGRLLRSAGDRQRVISRLWVNELRTEFTSPLSTYFKFILISM